MRSVWKACLAVAAIIGAPAHGQLPGAHELSVGQQVAITAGIVPGWRSTQESALNLTVERLGSTSLVPLSLEIFIPAGTQGQFREDQHLVSVSFYGIEPDWPTTFSFPLSREAMARLDSTSPTFGFRLSSTAQSQAAAEARVRIGSVTIGPRKD